MHRAVLDTNVLVSGLLKRRRNDIPDQILQRVEQFELCLSEGIIAEVRRVLHYARIQRKYHLSEGDIEEYLAYLRVIGKIIEDVPTIAAVLNDPDDNMMLACAMKVGAQYLVSGDPHLKDLKEYRGVAIVSPAEFLAALRE